MHLKVGDIVPIDSVETIDGNVIQLKGQRGYVHLQLRRYTGCCFCNVHLRAMSKITEQLNDLGITEVVTFASTKEAILTNQFSPEYRYGDFTKMDFIADPNRNLYKAFGAEQSILSSWKYYLTNPVLMTNADQMRAYRTLIPNDISGFFNGVHQFPMDAMIDCSNGKIIDIHYGGSPNDQWSPKEVLKIAKNMKRTMSLNRPKIINENANLSTGSLNSPIRRPFKSSNNSIRSAGDDEAGFP